MEVEMKDNKFRNAAVLAKIEREFGKFRIKNPGKKAGYPPKLRALVNSKEAFGLSVLAIGKAAKITPNSVRNWRIPRRGNCGPKAKELTVVCDNRESKIPMIGNPDRRGDTRITLKNGVVIELCVAELSTDFLRTLCELKADRC
jgi:hypothetical protein